MFEQFEAETGVKVNYDTFDSLEMLETKMLTGNSGYDVVVPSGPNLQRQVEAGVYRPLDRSRLANYVNLDPEMMAKLAQNDPGSLHAVGYMWGTTGIGYDARKVTALAPDAPSEIISIALIHLGKDPYSSDPADLAAAEAAPLAIRPYVRYVNSAPVIEDLASGSICVLVGWSGVVQRAAQRSIEAGLDTDIRYVIPEEGAASWFDVFAIPKDAPHPDEAHAFIDFMLRERSVQVPCARSAGPPARHAGAQPRVKSRGKPHLDALSNGAVVCDTAAQSIPASTSRRISMNAIAAGDGVRLASRMMP